jgi:anthranilate phosphoribosyltransferase
MSDFKILLARVAAGETLDADQARSAFDLIMDGAVSPVQISAFLMALRVRGETVAEIAGGAAAMRARATPVLAPDGAVDTCGTGGDGRGSLNISTAAAFVVAGAGVPVAKHGNRAASSRCGSADVLGALGIRLDLEPAAVADLMRETGFGFMLAPRHHGAMRHVAPVRGELGIRTIFNLLGPLANPAGARRQLVGVFAPIWVEPMARVLAALGAERAWVVHGEDGLDELTTTGATRVAEAHDGIIRIFSVTPEDAGLPRGTATDFAGGGPEENAAIIRNLLAGHAVPARDVVLLNAAATLVVAGRCPDLRTGVALARDAIESGRAQGVLEAQVARTSAMPLQEAVS